MGATAKAIFLSYASQDADAARRLCEALRAEGQLVWFDRNELRGGDAWDASIRKQIRECALFVPIISATTNARSEGYFRREWKLAVDRMMDLADDQPFLLPVAIDDVQEGAARVPDVFRERQWSRLSGGAPTADFLSRVARLLGETAALAAGTGATSGPVPPPEVPARPSGRRRLLIIAIALAGIGIAAWVGIGHFRRPAAVAPYSAQDLRMTFAVLPISAPEGDKTAAAFASSVTDALIARQTNSPWSRVVSRESTEDALKKYRAANDLGRALNVRYLVRGSVTRNGESFAVALSVLNAETDQVLGTREFKWPAGRPVNIYRPELDGAMGYLAGRGYILEVAQSKAKKPDDLDVRDLAYLANNAWKNDKASYEVAMPLLRRALAQSPNDRLALMLLVRVNLCECRNAWSSNPQEQEKIGADALDRYLDKYPSDRPMLLFKVGLYELHGRYEDALVLIDRLLEKSPDDPELLAIKASDLAKLGRDKEGLALIEAAMREDPSRWNRGTAAALHFKLGQYDEAAELAQKASAEMDRKEKSHPSSGGILLLRVAAETYRNRLPQAKAVLDEFYAVNPDVRTLSAMKTWQDPRADLAGYEPLYEGLRKAGVRD